MPLGGTGNEFGDQLLSKQHMILGDCCYFRGHFFYLENPLCVVKANQRSHVINKKKENNISTVMLYEDGDTPTRNGLILDHSKGFI